MSWTASTSYIYRTNASTGNQQKYTFSFWCKRNRLSQSWEYMVNSAYAGNTWRYSGVAFTTADQLQVFSGLYQSGSTGSTRGYQKTTERKFRDIGAWYHICVTVDTNLGTAGDRVKVFVNGVRQTSFVSGEDENPPSGMNAYYNVSGKFSNVGVSKPEAVHSPGQMFNGVLSHFYWCDGYAYEASTFGEVDGVSGIWRVKDDISVSYGTNGFLLKMEDSSNLDLDTGSNAFTMTTVGTLTASKDSPTNNFSTGNPLLMNVGNPANFAYGNNQITCAVSGYWGATSTLGMAKGLWYAELKPISDTTARGCMFGINGDVNDGARSNSQVGTDIYGWGYASNGGLQNNNSTTSSWGSTFADSDIMSVYVDLNANKLYFAKNNVMQNSGTGINITDTSSITDGVYHFLNCDSNSGGGQVAAWNFGNGYFGTTAVASAVADAGGLGQFEYDPSRGEASDFDSAAKDFRALCTKNIKAYGG